MATTQPVVKFTCEDYRTAPADNRYELLDGDLIHRQRAGALAATHTFGREQTLLSPLLVGLELYLVDVFSS